jgi:hypothetical protein
MKVFQSSKELVEYITKENQNNFVEKNKKRYSFHFFKNGFKFCSKNK